MSEGIPLDDGDRQGWLLTMKAALTEWLAPKSQHPAVLLACSALKKRYRGM